MSFGVIVSSRLAMPARGRPTNVDTVFLAVKTASGPTDKATLCQSILDFEAAYGERTGLTVAAWDWCQTAFQEGVKRIYVGRYVTDYTDAFALFGPELGPGQLVVEPNGTPPTDTVYTDMQTHCAYSDGPSMNNRVAIRDVPEGTTVTTLEGFGDDAPTNDDLGATFGPWLTVPAPPGVYGAGPRTIPLSAGVCGLIARADQDGNHNRAAAGLDYPFQYATGFEWVPSDVDRAGLFSHGVNSVSNDEDVLQLYGFQTNLPESEDNPFWQFNCVRERMYLKARAQVRGKPYVFRTIDGRGLLAGALKSDIAEEFKAQWEANGLYGDTAADAYYIEVGEVVNTVDEIAQGHLHAVCQARLSLHAKAVFIDLVIVPITGSVGQ